MLRHRVFVSHPVLSLIAAGVIATLGACGGGGGGGSSNASPANYSVSGAGQKGPYAAGSTVTAYALNATTGARTASSVTTTTDSVGNFNLQGISWTGPTEIVVSGSYFDEAQNVDSSSGLELSSISDLQGATAIRVNLFTHLLAGRIRTLMTSGSSYTVARSQALSDLARNFNLGLAGNIGPEALDISDGSSSNRQDNASLLLFSGSFLLTGAGTQTKVDALRDDFADDGRLDGAGDARTAARTDPTYIDTLRTRLTTKFPTLSDPPGVTDLGDYLPEWTSGGRLPDTGIAANQCYIAGSNTLVACNDPNALALSSTQDGMIGRDAESANNSDTDGRSGFQYLKLGMNGLPLAIQTNAYSPTGNESAGTSWSCVRDVLTGLTWEVKTDDNGLRDKDWTYSWYNSSGDALVGANYGIENKGVCSVADACDTEKYVAAINALTSGNRLCGMTDWRVPTAKELQTLVDYFPTSSPVIDTNFFPNSLGATYWSSSPYVEASSNYSVWAISFYDGQISTKNRQLGVNPLSDIVPTVRLVRSSR